MPGHLRLRASLRWATIVRAHYSKDRSPSTNNRNYETLQKSNLTPASATYEQIAAAYQQNKQAFLPVAVSPNMAGSLQTTIGDYAVFLAHVLKDISTRSTIITNCCLLTGVSIIRLS